MGALHKVVLIVVAVCAVAAAVGTSVHAAISPASRTPPTPRSLAAPPIPQGTYRGLDFLELPSKGITPASRFIFKGAGLGSVLAHVAEETTYAVEGTGVALSQFEAAMVRTPPYRIDLSVSEPGIIRGISIRMKTPWKRSE